MHFQANIFAACVNKSNEWKPNLQEIHSKEMIPMLKKKKKKKKHAGDQKIYCENSRKEFKLYHCRRLLLLSDNLFQRILDILDYS